MKWEVAAILGNGMGVEFKDRIMLNGFRVGGWVVGCVGHGLVFGEVGKMEGRL